MKKERLVEKQYLLPFILITSLFALWGFANDITTRIIVKPEIRSWEQAFGYEISEKEKSLGCIYMERVRLINDTPVFYDITMIPNLNLSRFTSRSFDNKSLFEMLRIHYQIEVRGGEQKILAITADPRIQEHFKVKKNHPILRLDRKMETNRVGLAFYSQIYCNTMDRPVIFLKIFEKW